MSKGKPKPGIHALKEDLACANQEAKWNLERCQGAEQRAVEAEKLAAIVQKQLDYNSRVLSVLLVLMEREFEAELSK